MPTLQKVHPARHRAQITVHGLSLIRGVTSVLHDVDLAVTPVSRIAIVGENGRGKSTLLHVLAGNLSPDRGTVQRIGTIGLAEQEMTAATSRTVGQAVELAITDSLTALAALDAASDALSQELPGADEAYSSALELVELLDAWGAQRRVEIALEALEAETDMTRLLAELSVGQRYRVRLACLLGANDDFLLLDEPTNHLDRSGLEFLTMQLRDRKGGVVVVSHDRTLLSDFAETIVDLDPAADERPHIYGNGYTGYREVRRAEQERWELAYERQQAEHGRLRDSLSAAQNRLVSKWRPEKGSPKHGRATRAGGLVQSVRRRQELLEAHAITVPPPPQRFHLPELPALKGQTLLAVEDVWVADRLCNPVSFVLAPGEHLVVTGPNGAGKTTLLNVAGGALAPTTGTVTHAPGSRLGFLHQETSLLPDLRANEVYARHVGALVAARTLPESEVVGFLRPQEMSKPVHSLLMRQQRRLDLALVLAQRPHVLLLDEPTNHLSIALVDELTEALGATRAAVVLSTHDRQLLRDVAAWPRLELGAD